MKAQVAVLIPTLNEEATIGRVIDRIPVHALSNDGYDTTSYVIDGDSEDRTQQKSARKRRSSVACHAARKRGSNAARVFSDPRRLLHYDRSVSYTHLRAHETDSYLVCRL